MKHFFKILMLTAVAAALCFAFAACGADAEDEDAAEDEYHYAAEDIENGTAFGAFKSADLAGNEVTDAIFADKDLTIVNVWGTYCGPCKDEMPDLAEWDKQLPDNVQIIGMLVDVPEGDADMIEVARSICADTGVKYTNIQTNDSVEACLASVEAVPTTFILDREGKTVCTPIIGADMAAYQKAVQEYLDAGGSD